MIRCLIDISIPEEDRCAKCCIYCEEKYTCSRRCPGVDEWKTEEEIYMNCTECA